MAHHFILQKRHFKETEMYFFEEETGYVYSSVRRKPKPQPLVSNIVSGNQTWIVAASNDCKRRSMKPNMRSLKLKSNL